MTNTKTDTIPVGQFLHVAIGTELDPAVQHLSDVTEWLDQREHSVGVGGEGERVHGGCHATAVREHGHSLTTQLTRVTFAEKSNHFTCF